MFSAPDYKIDIYSGDIEFFIEQINKPTDSLSRETLVNLLNGCAI
jgi:hypothetical protein